MKNLLLAIVLLITQTLLFCQPMELTSYDTMLARLNKLDQSSPLVSMSMIGKTAQGRDIPALFFSRGRFAAQRQKKPLALIFCQQHGDEASGKEAALLLANELLKRNDKSLDFLDIILIPSLNPDGSEMRQRRNGNNRDLNRNHVLLSEPETLALHRLFQEWFPEITLDVHEYGAISKWWVSRGVVKNADEMLGWLSNLNIDSAIRRYSQDIVYPAMKQLIENDGYILFPYTVGSPDENDRLRYSTNDIDDGRQSLGIYNTLSFILEGKGYGGVGNNLRRRSDSQLSAMKAFLKTVADRSQTILSMVLTARARLLEKVGPDERAFTRMDYFPDPGQPTIAFPVFNLEEWRAETQNWQRFEPLVKVKRSVRLPVAYIVPAQETNLIDMLQRHQVQMFQLKAPVAATVERYRILHVAARIEEERSMPEFDLEKSVEKTELNTGDFVIFLNQRARLLLPLLLEPESSWGIMTDTGGLPSAFSSYAREGHCYPILRLTDLE